MPSYFSVTNNGLFLFKPVEESGVQKSVFKDCFKTNKRAGSGDYAKMLHGKYRGSVKIMFDEDH